MTSFWDLWSHQIASSVLESGSAAWQIEILQHSICPRSLDPSKSREIDGGPDFSRQLLGIAALDNNRVPLQDHTLSQCERRSGFRFFAQTVGIEVRCRHSRDDSSERVYICGPFTTF